MNIKKINFIKLGNHWYPNIKHNNPSDLIIHPVLDRMLNRLDKFQLNTIDIYLMEQTDIVIHQNLLQFLDSDINRYCTTNDDFIMRLYIDNHCYSITSKLFTLLELELDLDLVSTLYRIQV